MIKLLMSYILLFSCTYGSEYKLSIAAIFQNEARFLKEWIEYHKLVGVEHFWLYNNDSSDNYIDALNPYILDGTVELFYWPDIWPDIVFPFGCQSNAYNDAISRALHKTEWLALIDLDEFIVPLQHSSISKTINKHFKKECGLYIEWLNFGSSDVEKLQPNELMIEKLTGCASFDHPHNRFRKSIVRPVFVSGCYNPHLCEYIQGMHREDKKVDKHLRINHYWCRDEWYLNNVKIPRYQKWDVLESYVKKLAKDFNQERDFIIQKFTKSLKEKIN